MAEAVEGAWPRKRSKNSQTTEQPSPGALEKPLIDVLSAPEYWGTLSQATNMMSHARGSEACIWPRCGPKGPPVIYCQCQVGRCWVNSCFHRYLVEPQVQRACWHSQEELLKVWVRGCHQRSLGCWVKMHIPGSRPPHIPLETRMKPRNVAF